MLLISFSRKSAAAIWAVALSCGTAMAADMTLPTKSLVPPPSIADGWNFSFAPYFWATSLSGSTTVKGYVTDVDAGFIEARVQVASA